MVTAAVRRRLSKTPTGERKRDSQKPIFREELLECPLPRLGTRPKPLKDGSDLRADVRLPFPRDPAGPVDNLQILGQ